MKFVDEFRDPDLAKQILGRISQTVTQPWVIMEICGGQTHAIMRHGLDQLLPDDISLVHGPGCPVCVTPLEYIDKAIRLSLEPSVILTTFGDMMRVPGSEMNLLTARSRGADVRMVYNPLDAVKLARENRDKKVVFFSVGFETTAPNSAMAVSLAKRERLDNFFLLVSHVLVPPAIEALVSSPGNRVNAYLLAGHVCAVMGWCEYEAISTRFKLPMVVTGFEPVDLLSGILAVVEQLESGTSCVENRYERVVTREGNLRARQLIEDVFSIVDRRWRGIGTIPQSGFALSSSYRNYDAETHFGLESHVVNEPANCISGAILQGLKKPPDCPAFGKECHPVSPLGATMVSSEGACSAYYKYALTTQRK